MTIHRVINYGLAFFLPPLLVGTAIALSTLTTIFKHLAPELPDQGAHPPAPKIFDPEAQQIIILLSSEGATDIFDAFSPLEVLTQTTKKTQVWTLLASAEKPKLVPTTGNLGILPDLNLNSLELNAILKSKNSLLILPSHTRPLGQTAIQWIKTQAQNFTWIFAPSEGAFHLFQALQARPFNDKEEFTTHFLAFNRVEENFSSFKLNKTDPFVLSGRQLTSGGGQSVLKGAQKLASLIYSDTPYKELKSSRPQALSAKDKALLVLAAAYDWYTPTISVWIEEGISELGLASVLTPYPRTLAAYVTTVSERRKYIPTKNGIVIVANEAVLYGAYYPDYIILPPSVKPLSQQSTSVQAWAKTRSGTEIFDDSGESPESELHRNLERVASFESLEWKTLVSKLLEVTSNAQNQTDSNLDLVFVKTLSSYLTKVIGLGCLGVFGLWLFKRRSSRLKKL